MKKAYMLLILLAIVALAACSPKMHYVKGDDGRLNYTEVTGKASPKQYFSDKRDEAKTSLAIDEGRTLEQIEAEIQEARRMGKTKLYYQLLKEKKAALTASTLYNPPTPKLKRPLKRRSSRKIANQFLQ